MPRMSKAARRARKNLGYSVSSRKFMCLERLKGFRPVKQNLLTVTLTWVCISSSVTCGSSTSSVAASSRMSTSPRSDRSRKLFHRHQYHRRSRRLGLQSMCFLELHARSRELPHLRPALCQLRQANKKYRLAYDVNLVFPRPQLNPSFCYRWHCHDTNSIILWEA